MYKDIELLSKKAPKDLKYDADKSYEFAKDLKLVTIGYNEVKRYSSLLPIIISGGNVQEFTLFCAFPWQENIFYKEKSKLIDIPLLLRAYPFLMVDAKEEGNEKKKFRAVAIDKTAFGADKSIPLFENDELSSYTKQKIKLAEELDRNRFGAKLLIDELKKHNLLIKRSFDIKVKENESKTILSDFYVVDKEKLYKLDDKLLVNWAKKGWLHIIEAHIESIENITKLLRD